MQHHLILCWELGMLEGCLHQAPVDTFVHYVSCYITAYRCITTHSLYSDDFIERSNTPSQCTVFWAFFISGT